MPLYGTIKMSLSIFNGAKNKMYGALYVAVGLLGACRRFDRCGFEDPNPDGGHVNSRSSNAPKRHHYVPQFYLRRFAAAGDRNKVGIAERHGEIVATDVKSIGSIGYEEGLHDFEADGATGSIEQDLNKSIETPFSISRTWSKIEEGDTGKLDAVDALSIYGFARHLQRRNVRTLRFLEVEHARFAQAQSMTSARTSAGCMRGSRSSPEDRTSCSGRGRWIRSCPRMPNPST